LAFSVLLATRYDTFAIVLVVFVAERVWRRKLAFAPDAVPMILGALPITIAFLGYNWAITGNPLLTTIQWLRPDFGIGPQATGPDGPYSVFGSVIREEVWISELCLYGGCGLAAAYVFAAFSKLRRFGLRFFDALPAACVLVFFFFTDVGGHQFGPRYWLFAWPTIVLTIGTELLQADGWMRFFRWRLHLPTFAVLQVVGFAGTTFAIALLFRNYVDARREVYEVRPPLTPSLVLIPPREFTLSPWHPDPYLARTKDFTRNGTDFSGSVLYGRADVPGAIELACRLEGRTVYLWQSPGQLKQVDCREVETKADG
jgi:hypothetical protein